MHKITLIPGDGVGREVTDAALKCIEAAGVDIEWEKHEAGSDVMEKTGTPLPESVLESIRRNKVALKGPITTPVGEGFRSVNVALRQKLCLYACLRPCRSYPGIPSPYKGIDIVVVRENTEDLYAGIEFAKGEKDTGDLIDFIRDRKKVSINDDSGISIKPISSRACERIVRFAFEYAKRNGRKKVTAVHKANIMKYSDGIFLDAARRVARDYKNMEFEDRIVDNMCMQLVKKPLLYDVIVLPNLYGDIISDLCAGLIGGLGVAPGANMGDGIAIFEPTHGSAPKYRGQDKVNPTATILSGVLMLKHIGEEKAAASLEKAVARVLEKGKDVTYDLGGKSGTSAMAEAVVREMRR